jgi:hypothetical protein
VNAWEATFGATRCHVRVEARSTAGPQPVFAATPFVIAKDPNVFYWCADEAGEPVQFLDGTEDRALARAATFLVERFGQQGGRFARAPERSAPVVLKPLTRQST